MGNSQSLFVQNMFISYGMVNYLNPNSALDGIFTILELETDLRSVKSGKEARPDDVFLKLLVLLGERARQ